jgi:hypothetical protein
MFTISTQKIFKQNSHKSEPYCSVLTTYVSQPELQECSWYELVSATMSCFSFEFKSIKSEIP